MNMCVYVCISGWLEVYEELEQFIGTAVYMSLFGLPGTHMFWNKATQVSQVADSMALNQW